VLSAVTLVGCSSGSGGVDGGPSITQTSSRPASPTANPVAAVRREIAAAQEGYYRSYLAAAAAPGDQSRVGDLLGRYTPTSKPGTAVRDRMSSLASRGFTGRAGSGSYYVIEKIDVVGLPPAGRAVETVCGYDDSVIYDARRKAPDGREIVVDDTPTSGRTRITWVQQDGWKIDQAEVLGTWEGENRCPPRPGS
jgi:hypothetical protein